MKKVEEPQSACVTVMLMFDLKGCNKSPNNHHGTSAIIWFISLLWGGTQFDLFDLLGPIPYHIWVGQTNVSDRPIRFLLSWLILLQHVLPDDKSYHLSFSIILLMGSDHSWRVNQITILPSNWCHSSSQKWNIILLLPQREYKITYRS